MLLTRLFKIVQTIKATGGQGGPHIDLSDVKTLTKNITLELSYCVLKLEIYVQLYWEPKLKTKVLQTSKV